MEMTNVLFNTETLGNGPKILAIRKKIVDLKKKENKTKKTQLPWKINKNSNWKD